MVDEYKTLKRQQKHQYGIGYSAINSHLCVLNRIFQKAMEYGHVSASPVLPTAWLRREKTPEDSTNWWTADEEDKAFTHLWNVWRSLKPRRYMPLMVQLVTGIHVGELRVLRRMDLELEANTPGIWIRRSMARKKISTPKNGHTRFVPIPRDFVEEVRAWASLREPEALLFPGEHGGPLRNNVVNRWFAALCEEAGVRRISSHGARHTTGSTLAAMGAGQKVIGVALGHRDSKATERYTHVQASVVAPLTEARWQKLASGAGRHLTLVKS
jgi:integrase